MHRLFLLMLLVLATPGLSAGPQVQVAAQALVDDLAAHSAPGAAVVVLHGRQRLAAAAAGWADEGAQVPLSTQTPLRIASVTKPYVAATLLRLAAAEGISLDSAAAGYLPDEALKLLRVGGYPVEQITLRHLLSHSAGLPDHFESLYFRAVSFLLRDWQWTATEQVELMTGLPGPLGPPGQRYYYSDTGYVLLGQVIETLSGQPLYAAVREQVDFAASNLDQTWWEMFETAPPNARPRARQYMYGLDITGLHPTVDLYGGGGLIASTRDMARFFAALFDPSVPGGRVLRDPSLLAAMLDANPGMPPSSNYRLGINRGTIQGMEAYTHSGFWGTLAMYLPALDVTIAMAVTERTALQVVYARRGELVSAVAASRLQE